MLPQLCVYNLCPYITLPVPYAYIGDLLPTHEVDRHWLRWAVVDHLELLRSGESAEMLVLRKRSPAL